jgi:hypothetical protein
MSNQAGTDSRTPTAIPRADRRPSGCLSALGSGEGRHGKRTKSGEMSSVQPGPCRPLGDRAASDAFASTDKVMVASRQRSTILLPLSGEGFRRGKLNGKAIQTHYSPDRRMSQMMDLPHIAVFACRKAQARREKSTVSVADQPKSSFINRISRVRFKRERLKKQRL